jgi:hypothetical protein
MSKSLACVATIPTLQLPRCVLYNAIALLDLYISLSFIVIVILLQASIVTALVPGSVQPVCCLYVSECGLSLVLSLDIYAFCQQYRHDGATPSLTSKTRNNTLRVQ